MIFLRTHILQVAVPGLELSFCLHQSNMPSPNYMASRQTLQSAPFWQLLLEKDQHTLYQITLLSAQWAGLQAEPHDRTVHEERKSQRLTATSSWPEPEAPRDHMPLAAIEPLGKASKMGSFGWGFWAALHFPGTCAWPSPAAALAGGTAASWEATGRYRPAQGSGKKLKCKQLYNHHRPSGLHPPCSQRSISQYYISEMLCIGQEGK